MSTFKRERMEQSIRRVVSEKLMRSGSVIPNGLMTINRVSLAPDYTLAKIFFSLFGANISEEDAAKLMKSHVKEYRYELAQRLNFKKTPRISFCFDKNTAYASKIDKLLK